MGAGCTTNFKRLYFRADVDHDLMYGKGPGETRFHQGPPTSSGNLATVVCLPTSRTQSAGSRAALARGSWEMLHLLSPQAATVGGGSLWAEDNSRETLLTECT